jgi:hypothetical protein
VEPDFLLSEVTRASSAITLAAFVPSNARLPVSISYSTRPKEKMLLRASAGLPWACSWDMYYTVPMIMCSPVSVCCPVGNSDGT